MKKIAILVLIAILSSGCASLAPREEAFIGCSALDLGTTAYALRQPGFREINPILKDLKDWQVVAVGTAASVVVFYALKKLDKDWLWWSLTGTKCAIGAWNLKEIINGE